MVIIIVGVIVSYSVARFAYKCYTIGEPNRVLFG